MSSWPVVGIECYRCDNYLTVFHLDFDVCHTDEEQATFVKVLAYLGWDTDGLPDTEVNDDGMWTRLCPNCAAVEMIRRLYEIDGEPT